MRLLVAVPSAEALGGAGVRIRYRRLAAPLARRGVTLEVATVDEVELARLEGLGALVLSKATDVRAAALAHGCRRQGVRVVLDLFDDYYSQTDRTALRHLQRELRQLLPLLDGALVSTEPMAEVARAHLAGLPLHALRDPRDEDDTQAVADLQAGLERRLREAAATGVLSVAWFGMGDNPHFDVGLHDLAAGSDQLRALERGGWRVELTVLTNERALGGTGLRALRALPIATRVEPWSEDRERELLSRSLVAFLPVARQSFSRVKSPNRGITALGSGCQILNTGHPLYDDYAAFVYRDPAELLQDLAARRLKLRAQTMGDLIQLFDLHACADREAEALAGFMSGLPAGVPPKGPLVVVHGIRINAEQHKTCRKHGGFSVASPLTRGTLGWDLTFQGRTDGSQLAAVLSDRLLKAIADDTRRRIASKVDAGTQGRHVVALEALDEDFTAPAGGARRALARALGASSLPEMLVMSPWSMACTSRIVRRLLPAARLVVNEQQPGLELAR